MKQKCLLRRVLLVLFRHKTGRYQGCSRPAMVSGVMQAVRLAPPMYSLPRTGPPVPAIAAREM
jgi:hypothetical protein